MDRKPFRFKQFAMTDARCGMRINTDGVLLGAWASVVPVSLRRILDVGCGCGIIALMMAQRAPYATVEAIDCDPGAISAAAANFASSPWVERISLVDNTFENYCSSNKFDLVVSNPPFFTEALKSPEVARAKARHEGELSFEALAARARSMLTPDGRLAVILPADADARIIAAATMHAIYPRRHCMVRTRPDLPYVRSLWEFSPEDGKCDEEVLTIRNCSGELTIEYKSLTHEFHIFL
ncbi:MAG: methyltransferase [Muribaculaceae bacterium]|nr:methyltransferase [Muribaculaceae bacterium]